MSDTPRTDALEKSYTRADDPAGVFEFARQLERELRELAVVHLEDNDELGELARKALVVEW